jgi:RimJ/RimL family protein N-acetyltransferase
MSKRIYLRALELEDYKISIQWRKDKEIWDMLGGRQYFVSEAYEKKWVEDSIFQTRDIKLAICLRENDLYIGNVYMTDFDYINRSCNSHVLIGNRNYWGRGYAGEALKELLSFVFYERNINRVSARILEDNMQSLRLHEKLGFKKDGLLRQSVYKNGKYKNQYILSILMEEFDIYNKERAIKVVKDIGD